jgi:hypothetical protein
VKNSKIELSNDGSTSSSSDDGNENEEDDEAVSVSMTGTQTLDSTANTDDDGNLDASEGQKKWQPKICLSQCQSTPASKARLSSLQRPPTTDPGRTLRSRIVNGGDHAGNSNSKGQGRKKPQRKSEPTATKTSSSTCGDGGLDSNSSSPYDLKRLSIDLGGTGGGGVSTRATNAKGKAVEAGKKKTFGEDEVMKVCQDLVSELMARDEAWPFRRPVGRREAPGYIDIVRQPMDFGTIKSKMADSVYSSPQQVLDDIRLIFHNCAIYYGTPASPERLAGQKLSRHFDRRVRELGLGTSTLKPESKLASKLSRK